jgi:RNA polymerase sigma factor (sigma-70 family)
MRDEASFLHWLGTVAANHIRDLADQAHAARRDVRREASPRARPGDSTHVLEIMGSAATPSQEAARAELAQIVDECVHGLPEPQRELILMRSYAGMDWKSIGDRLGIAEDAARMRHATAKVALARLLAARGIAPPQ